MPLQAFVDGAVVVEVVLAAVAPVQTACHLAGDFDDKQSTPNTQIPRSTPAWDTFGLILNVVTKLCKADITGCPGEIQPTASASKSHKSGLASSQLKKIHRTVENESQL